MKQIIPFKKELLFKTRVSEITSISLEHTLSLKNNELISGEFHITGDYKMTEGSLQRENFAFNLPFEIAMDSQYDTSSIIIDIDNFYYEIINSESLQVNIDVYIEGEKIEPIVEKDEVAETKSLVSNLSSEEKELKFPDLSDFITKEDIRLERKEENIIVPEIECSDEIEFPEPNVEYPKIANVDFENLEDITTNQSISNKIPSIQKTQEFNLFENVDSSDTYVTYYVYIVKESDTIDTILNKYEVTKDSLALYNQIEEIKPGMKLIIPNER